LSQDLKAIAPKLCKLLLLLLRNEQDNEALTARSKLLALLRDNGLDAHDLVATLFVSEAGAGRPTGQADIQDSDKSTVGWCHRRRNQLTARDRAFIESLMTWRRPISDSQRQWLRDIVGKLERAEAA
jgi:hypothetical protein